MGDTGIWVTQDKNFYRHQRTSNRETTVREAYKARLHRSVYEGYTVMNSNTKLTQPLATFLLEDCSDEEFAIFCPSS